MIYLSINNKKEKKRAQIKTINTKIITLFNTLLNENKKRYSKHIKKHWKIAKKICFSAINHKEWYYSILNYISSSKYQLNNFKNINKKKIKELSLQLDSYKIVLINGCFDKKLSSTNMGPFKISNTQHVLPKAIKSNFFLHINECFVNKPLFIYLSANNFIEKPLYLLNISSGSNKQEISINQYRYHLIIDTNSKAYVIEHFVSLNKKNHITGGRLTVEIKDNSEYNHFKLNDENNQAKHFSDNDIFIGKNNKIKSNNFLLGGFLTRNSINSCINGKHSELEINSLLIPKNNEIIDIQTYVEHKKSLCNSNQLHKIIGMDKSKSIFNGLIKVKPIAIKTNAKMTSNTLLLGEQAKVYSKPQLEIYTDDVKCNHGTTVDYINKEQLFYMCSRGINNKIAKKMIIFSVATKLTDTINLKELKQAVIKKIHQRLIEI
ncbi:Fe-S cluster assembly protein SufD [Candidatus Providencia siddallii]|uniref:FeS cluster assembly protein SufD n=1 Tax=Candidatus Providencia siddallii TaxID=1715285 RepID=A0ABM9NPJ1_9GAMM